MWFYIAMITINLFTLSIVVVQLIVQCRAIKNNTRLLQKAESLIPVYTSESSHPSFIEKRLRLAKKASTNTKA